MSTSCFPIKDKTCEIEAYNLQQYSIRKGEQNPLNFCTRLGTTFGPPVEKHWTNTSRGKPIQILPVYTPL
jgi:hypothetical protein